MEASSGPITERQTLQTCSTAGRGAVSAAASHAIAAGSHQAFVSGLHTAMLVTACACFAASGLGLLLSSRKQPHPAGASLEPAVAKGR